MKPAPFEYVRPDTLDAAVQALNHEDARIIAGGQSLVPMMNFRLVQPERLVDINRIEALTPIVQTDTGVRVGALTRHVEAEYHPLLREHFPIISEAMPYVAHLAIRNRGTIAGSLCHADPSAEWPLLAILLNAEIEILGGSGSRTVPAEEFFMAPLTTDIAETELVTGVFFPSPPASCGTAFDEVSWRAGDFAVVAAGALVYIEKNRFANVRLVLGGVSDTPIRITALEEALVGQSANQDAIEAVLSLTTKDLEPNDDLHASAEYRLSLVHVLARRVLTCALERASS
ncbi:MAG: xanthine dehydrogenase family protein subunit M [Aestuariivita sp.]|nr:xanthine dehydrogenase family protein subunit M [Aestuariivita sp.]MCY4203344.1 xanthine dehydrogenase family protein subunit M [Aestuariivita sp.]